MCNLVRTIGTGRTQAPKQASLDKAFKPAAVARASLAEQVFFVNLNMHCSDSMVRYQQLCIPLHPQHQAECPFVALIVVGQLNVGACTVQPSLA